MLQLFLYSFHASVSLNNNLTSMNNLQISSFLFISISHLSCDILPLSLPLSLYSTLPLLALLTSGILSVTLVLTTGNRLCH